MVINLIGSKEVIIYRELLQDKLLQHKPDITLDMKEPNWESVILLKVGLVSMNDYFMGLC